VEKMRRLEGETDKVTGAGGEEELQPVENGIRKSGAGASIPRKCEVGPSVAQEICDSKWKLGVRK
jgi:hypothetical protein